MSSILGIDPGLSETGWAFLSGADRPSLVASGLIATPAGMPLPTRLRNLHARVLQVLDERKPDSLALEQLFFLRSNAAMAATSQARGVVLLAAELRGCPVREYNPRDVKVSITGNGAAPKAQMQKMVRMLLGLAEPLRPHDVADAAAIALCDIRTQRFKARIAA